MAQTTRNTSPMAAKRIATLERAPLGDVLVELADVDPEPGVGVRMIRADARGDGGHLRLRSPDGDTRLAPSEHVEQAEVAHRRHLLVQRVDPGGRREREPHIGAIPVRSGEAKPLGRDPDDGEGDTVERDAPTDDRGICGEAAVPQVRADDDHARCSDAVIRLLEQAAEQRPERERVERSLRSR